MGCQIHFFQFRFVLLNEIGKLIGILVKIYGYSAVIWQDIQYYQSPLILSELFQHNLINVSYLTACYLYQVMMTLHFLNDVANDAESTQKSKITS